MIDKFRYRLNDITSSTFPLEDAFWVEAEANYKLLTINKGEVLVRYNSLSQDLYYIVEGSFKCSQVLEDGQSKAIWFHFKEQFDFMACPDSFFTDEFTKYELEAIEDAVLMKFSKQLIYSWILRFRGFNYLFIHGIISDFVTIYEARSSLLALSSLDFLRYSKEKFPILFEKLPAYYVAEFMGVSPEWYSKLQKKLKS